MTENINDIEDIQLILDYKRVEAMRRHTAPDVDQELNRFWQKYGAGDSVTSQNQATDTDQYELQRTTAKNNLKWKKWLIAASAAAVILIGVSFTIFFSGNDTDRLQIYTASASAKSSMLEIDGKDAIMITGDRPDKTLYAQGIVATRHGIDMRKSTAGHGAKHQLSLTTPCGQDYTVTLADGTVVVLNAGSQISFPDEFGKGERVVYLKGEAMFDVAHDPKHPFIVKTDFFETKVLGTKFNLRSYSKEDSHVTLLEGKVTVSKSQSPEVTLEPSEQASLTQTGEIKKQKVDTYPYLEWQNGYFYFDNASLVEIMKELGRWYNVDVVFKNEKLLDYRIHFAASREESLMEAIRNLNTLDSFNVSLDGRRLTIQ